MRMAELVALEFLDERVQVVGAALGAGARDAPEFDPLGVWGHVPEVKAPEWLTAEQNISGNRSASLSAP
jgi:hypothetical protein